MGKKQKKHTGQNKNQQKKIRSYVKMKPLKQRIPDPLVNNSNQYCPSGYTQEQFDRYREELDRIKDLTNFQLKDILKINNQTVYIHSKAELQYRCADGYALGRTQICPSCFSAVPIYDKTTGTYYCKGFKDQQTGEFNACDTFYQKDQLTRTKWDNNFLGRQQAKKLKMKNQKNQNHNSNSQETLKLENQEQILVKIQAKEECQN